MRGTWAEVVVAVSMGAIVACGGSGPSTSSTTVTGSRLVTYWKDDGSTEREPANLGGASVAALVLEDGAWREAPGTFAEDGTFTIPDVGAGSYLLRLSSLTAAPRYYAESVRSVDLGYNDVGRPAATRAALATPVAFSITGMQPWANGDTLRPFSTGSRLNQPPTWTAAGGAVAGDFALDFQDDLLPEAGDVMWVLQTERVGVYLPDDRLVTCYVVVRSGSVALFESVADGGSTTLSLDLAAPPQRTASANVERSAFAAMLPDMAPAGTLEITSSSVSVRAVAHGLLGVGAAGVTVAAASLPTGTDDIDLGTLTYPVPFPAWFSVVRSTQLFLTANVPAALGAPAGSLTFVWAKNELLAGAPVNVRPSVGPARLPRIDGFDAQLAQPGVGLTPTLSWSPPSIGAATRFTVSVYEQKAQPALRGTITVVGTSVVLPPGMLEEGKVYVAVITTAYEPGWDAAAPNRHPGTGEAVPSFTAAFSP